MAVHDRKHILVVEESRVLREAIQDLLAGEGFEVTASEGGAGARDLLQSRATEFDLIVVNLQAPAAGHFDVVEWLRAERPRLGIPILAVTGPTRLALAAERLRGLEAAGVQDTRTLWDQLPYRVRAVLNPKEADQRAAVRMPSGLPVNLRVGSTVTQGIIGNISRVGMFVKIEGSPGPGQEVLLQFILPDIARLFEVRGRVVWSARRETGAAAPGMGVEFLEVDQAGTSQLSAYVRRELEKFGSFPTS